MMMMMMTVIIMIMMMMMNRVLGLFDLKGFIAWVKGVFGAYE